MRWEGTIETGGPVEDDEEITLLPSKPNTWVSAGKRPNPVAYPIGDHSSALTDSHLASLETIRETATPIQRGIGLCWRLLPWLIPWLAICFGILYLLDDPLIPLLAFAVLTAVTVYGLNQQDYAHSAAGVERHKADLAHDLASQKQADTHELSKTALESYIKHLEKGQ